MTSIVRWMNIAVVLGLVSASAAAADNPIEINVNGITFPGDPIVSVKPFDDKTTEVTTQTKRVIRITGPASTAPVIPTGTGVSPITVDFIKLPVGDVFVSAKPANDTTTELQTKLGRVIHITNPGGTPPDSPPQAGNEVRRMSPSPQARSTMKKDQLTREEWADISEELSDVKRNSPDVSGELLREGLMDKAEALAANYLKVAPADLPASIHRQLRIQVDRLISPGGPNSERRRPDPRPADRGSYDRGSYDRDPYDRAYYDRGSYDGGYYDHCTCEHCQPSQLRTGFAPPYALAYPPTMSYASMPYGPTAPCPAPYPARRGFLHHLLCPCSWCRGGR